VYSSFSFFLAPLHLCERYLADFKHREQKLQELQTTPQTEKNSKITHNAQKEYFFSINVNNAQVY